MTDFPRGSEWRRWELHVHSPLSILNNKFHRLADDKPDWDTYVQVLEAKPIAVYGITDYFNIDGYKELKDRQSKGALAGHRLLPNIEFRLDRFVSSKHDGGRPRRLNLHVIFSDEVTAEDIEEHFLYDLNFVYQENPLDTNYRMTLKSSNLIKLGERLIREHAKFPIMVGQHYVHASTFRFESSLRLRISRFARVSPEILR